MSEGQEQHIHEEPIKWFQEKAKVDNARQAEAKAKANEMQEAAQLAQEMVRGITNATLTVLDDVAKALGLHDDNAYLRAINAARAASAMSDGFKGLHEIEVVKKIVEERAAAYYKMHQQMKGGV